MANHLNCHLNSGSLYSDAWKTGVTEGLWWSSAHPPGSWFFPKNRRRSPRPHCSHQPAPPPPSYEPPHTATQACLATGAASLWLQTLIGFPFLDRTHSPGDEFPHYLRDLHVGRAPGGPECPRSVDSDGRGRGPATALLQAWGSQGQPWPVSLLSFKISLHQGPGWEWG